MRWVRSWPLGVGFALALGLAAQGQVVGRQASIDDLISRPGSSSPSLNLGGRYTPYDLQPLQSTRSPVSMFANTSPSIRQSTRVGSGNSRLANIPRTGLLSEIGNLPWSPIAQIEPVAEEISGLRVAGQLALPIVTAGYGYMPGPDGFLYTPRQETTRAQQLLGVTPVRGPLQSGPMFRTLGDGLRQQTEVQTNLELVKGLELFRAATVEPRRYNEVSGRNEYPTCKDCTERLYRAIDVLNLVREVDRDAALPLVLVAHGRLELEQPTAALMCLMKAYQRDPRVFLERRPIDEFFGDAKNGKSVYLDQQMRRYLEMGAVNPGSTEARVIEAYCAWRLGESDRLAGIARDLDRTMSTDAQFIMLRTVTVALLQSVQAGPRPGGSPAGGGGNPPVPTSAPAR